MVETAPLAVMPGRSCASLLEHACNYRAVPAFLCNVRDKHSPSDLSDEAWSRLQPLIPPPKPGGRPREVDMRAVVTAVLYVEQQGGGWRRLPLHFPPWQTVYGYVRAWKRDGTWEALRAQLRRMDRAA